MTEAAASSFEEILNKTGTLVYKTRGVSMRPLLRQNRDVVVLTAKDPAVRCRRLDAVLFKRQNGAYVLHRILKVRPHDYWIVGDNCISGEEVREEQVLAVLTSVKRNGREIRAADPGYRIYAHLWGDLWPVRFVLLRCRNLAFRVLRKIRRMLKSVRKDTEL